MSELSRNEEQVLIMNILYQTLLFDKGNIKYDVIDVISDTAQVDYSDVSIFVKQTVIEALLHKDEIISKFVPFLKGWSFDRLAYISQAILLMSYSHFFLVEDKADRKVIINVAINLAKRYLDTDKDYKFINAILENVIK